MAYYRVQISAEIQGNYLEDMERPYFYYGMKSVETLDNSYQPNVIYKSKDKFQYCVILNEPTQVDIYEAKRALKNKMLLDLGHVINNLSQIYEKISKENIE